jgi:hypothetical protein
VERLVTQYDVGDTPVEGIGTEGHDERRDLHFRSQQAVEKPGTFSLNSRF